MRKGLLLFILLWMFSESLIAQSSLRYWNDRLDDLYEEFVRGGDVDYNALAKQSAPIHELNAIMRNMDSLDQREEKAFLINAYNLIVIGEIVRHWPIQSVRDVPGFFDGISHDVGPFVFTLDELEEHLFKRYPDPRMHLVLVCGAEGCPPIYKESYRSTFLDAQLDSACRKALDDPVFLRELSDGYQLSRIFRWYANDFGGREGIRSFVTKYRPELEDALTGFTYYPYNWSVNEASTGNMLQVFTPSFLLPQGQVSAKWFHNLYTQTAFFDDSGGRIKGGRSTFYTNIFELDFGFSRRINLGMDAFFRSVHYGGNSPLGVLSFGDSEQMKTALTHAGPKIKFQPFRSIPHLSAEVTWLFPLTGDLEENPYLEDDGHQGLFQIFYDRVLGDRAQLFVELGLWSKFDEDFELDESSLQIPMKPFINYFLSDRWTVYLNNEFNPTPGEGDVLNSWYLQSGFGSKFLLTDQIEIEILYTNFWAGQNAGAGQTFNVGFRYLSK